MPILLLGSLASRDSGIGTVEPQIRTISMVLFSLHTYCFVEITHL